MSHLDSAIGNSIKHRKGRDDFACCEEIDLKPPTTHGIDALDDPARRDTGSGAVFGP
jgi:hypothetical protein